MPSSQSSDEVHSSEIDVIPANLSVRTPDIEPLQNIFFHSTGRAALNQEIVTIIFIALK